MTRKRRNWEIFWKQVKFNSSGVGVKPVFRWPLPRYKRDSCLLILGFDHRNAAKSIAFSLVQWLARVSDSVNLQLSQEAVDSFSRRRMGDRFWRYHSLSLACHLFISDFWAKFEMQVQGFTKCFLFSPFMVSDNEILWGHGGCPP